MTYNNCPFSLSLSLSLSLTSFDGPNLLIAGIVIIYLKMNDYVAADRAYVEHLKFVFQSTLNISFYLCFILFVFSLTKEHPC